MLQKEIITEVIKYCNKDLVPDKSFDGQNQYPSEWFEDYFSFLQNTSLSKHLGDAFYQARFMYKLMSALGLKLAKQKGIVKFQIIQYASICEAVLDYTIETFFKDDALSDFSVVEYTKCINAMSKSTKITYGNEDLFLCKYKKKKGELKRTRVDFKAEFAVEKGIISNGIKTQLCDLYDLRNNIHILKASETNYTPRLYEAKNAFQLMMDFTEEIKVFFETQKKGAF
jgi:hypothetical protein